MKVNLAAFVLNKQSWSLWFIFIVIISVYVTLLHNTRSVTHHYRDASISWEKGQALYVTDNNEHGVKGRGFLYLPQAALLFTPFAKLPVSIGEILWRIFSLGLFAIGLAQLARLGHPEKNYFSLMTILSIPLAVSSARNGQMNIIMTAFFMFAATSLVAEKWWHTGFYLTLSLVLKPIAIVYLLLVGALYKPVRKPLFVCLIIMLLFPFLTQKPDYVLQQYKDCMQMFVYASNVGSTHTSYPHFFNMLLQFNIQLDPMVQNIIRALFALATCYLGFIAKKRFDPATASVWIFILATGYLALFNPRTEYNSYIILAPALGYVIAHSIFSEANKIKSIILMMIYMGILFGDDLIQLMNHHHRITLIAPLATTIFLLMITTK